MKFIVSSSVLAKSLQTVSGVLNNNSPLPILSHFLFDIDRGQLDISASDLETTMTTSLKVETKDSGKVAVPARILLETIKTFGDEPLTFSLNNKTFGIEIGTGQGKFKLMGMNGEEFPKIPTVERASFIDLPSSVLAEAINKTIFATGNDELRPVMNGVFCQLSPDDVVFVATDAHRLVRYRRTDARSQTNVSFIMPKKPLGLLKSSLPSDDTQVHIEYNEANAFFSFPDCKLICRLIDGKYPQYEAVIPKENPNKLVINRSQFLNSLRRVAIFSNKTTHQVKLKIAGSQVQINAEDVDFSNEATELLPCNYDGVDLEIAFNSRFLIEMLSNLQTEEIQMNMSLPNRAGLITPVSDAKDSHEDILMLVMPVMIG
nr:DNA polymerase III subunit beta [Bacteroidota bacterium]